MPSSFAWRSCIQNLLGLMFLLQDKMIVIIMIIWVGLLLGFLLIVSISLLLTRFLILRLPQLRGRLP